MQIRTYEPADLDGVVRLSLRAWAPVFDSMQTMMDITVFSAIYPDWRVSQREAVETVCRSAEMKVWVAVEPEIVLGFVAVKQHTEANMGEVYMVAVDPGAQRRGVGRALMDFSLRELKAMGSAIVMVGTGGDPGHAPARRLYEKMGLRPLPLVQYYGRL